MALEPADALRIKNKKRLRRVKISGYIVGVNISSPSRLKDSVRILGVVILILSSITCYGLVEFIIRYRKNVLQISESCCLLLQTLISIFKLTYSIIIQRRFYRVMWTIESHALIEEVELLRNEKPFNKELRKDAIEIMDNCWNIALRQFTYYMFATSSIVGWYFFRALSINTYHAIKGNTNHTNILAYPILFTAWEDKMNKFPYYPILTITVGTGDFIAGLCALFFDGVFIIMTMHAVALFRVLKKMITFTTHPDVPKGMRIEYLRQCIFLFENTYKFCDRVNEIYMHMGIIQFILSLAILGILMFQVALGIETDFMIFFRMVLYISAAGYQPVLFCLNGQFVTNECNSMAEAWYECKWYNESKEFKTLIHMMMLRTSRTFYMRASWFTTMSLPTLLAILRTSGSYFLFLRNLAFA